MAAAAPWRRGRSGGVASAMYSSPSTSSIARGLEAALAIGDEGASAMIVLGIVPSFGSESALVRRGPYRFSRNPQYVGFIVGLIGWVFLSSSRLAAVASLAGMVPLIAVPFTEEGWLLARHGAAYEEYRRGVPRYVSLKSRSGAG